MPRFAYNKNQLSRQLQRKMNDAELKFITTESRSFNVLENDGVLSLVQTAIDIGVQMGRVNVCDVFYRRKTICIEGMVNSSIFQLQFDE